MKVNIEYEDGQYHLRWFRERRCAGDIESFRATGEWETAPQTVEVPESVVETYCTLASALSTMNALLRFYDNAQREER